MSGLYPDSPAPAEAELESYKPTFVSTSNSGKRQSRDGGLHLWKVDFVYPVLSDEQFAPIDGFVEKQDGSLEEFQVVLPQKAEPLGVATGTPETAFNANAGAKLALITGFTGSVAGIMKAGDVLTFDNHTKVYKMTEDATTDAGGNTTLKFRPALIVNVPIGTLLTVTGVEFTMYIDGIHKYKTKSALNHSYTIKMIESL